MTVVQAAAQRTAHELVRTRPEFGVAVESEINCMARVVHAVFGVPLLFGAASNYERYPNALLDAGDFELHPGGNWNRVRCGLVISEQSFGVYESKRVRVDISIRIQAAVQPLRVAFDIPSDAGVVIAEVVVVLRRVPPILPNYPLLGIHINRQAGRSKRKGDLIPKPKPARPAAN